jgi:anti-sigma factor RsiW
MSETDERLSAYLDQALPPAEMAQLARQIAGDPALQERLDGFRAADLMAAGRMAGVLAEPVPMALAQAVARAWRDPATDRRGLTAWVWAGLGALAGVAATLAVVGFRPAPPRPWTDEVAAYHRIYAQETAHLVEVGADRADHIRAWLGARIGRDFVIPDLGEFGLTFRGGRLLVAAGAPVAQLVYTDAAGGVVALCLTSRPGAPDAAPAPLDLGDLDAVLWRDGGTAIVLIGPRGGVALGPVAETVARLL